MKTIFLFTLAIFGFFPACKHARQEQQTITWKCGEGALTVTKTLKTGKSGDLTLTLDRKSLCQSNAIKVQVMANDKPAFEETVTKFPFTKTWKLDRDAAVSITTEVVKADSNVRCIRLGEVQCTARY